MLLSAVTRSAQAAQIALPFSSPVDNVVEEDIKKIPDSVQVHARSVLDLAWSEQKQIR